MLRTQEFCHISFFPKDMDEQGDGTIAPREMRDRLEATKNYTK